MKKNKVLLVLIVVSIFSCTSNKDCGNIEFTDFEREFVQTPLFYIKNMYSYKCPIIYNFQLNIYYNEDVFLEKEVKMIFESNSFKILENHDYVDFLNLNSKKGEFYSINVNERGKNYKIITKLQDTINYNSQKFYIFRFKNVYNYYGHKLDNIVICTKKNGIIGSYFTDSDEKIKTIISPIGNILKDVIDYSAYQKRVLQ